MPTINKVKYLLNLYMTQHKKRTKQKNGINLMEVTKDKLTNYL